MSFAIYYSYYKNKFIGNLTWKFVSAINCLYFLYGWNNLLAAFFFTYGSNIFAVELDIITKKKNH